MKSAGMPDVIADVANYTDSIGHMRYRLHQRQALRIDTVPENSGEGVLRMQTMRDRPIGGTRAWVDCSGTHRDRPAGHTSDANSARGCWGITGRDCRDPRPRTAGCDWQLHSCLNRSDA